MAATSNASARELAESTLRLVDPLRKQRKFTTAEVAEYFQKSVETIHSWRKEGRIGFGRDGRTVYFLEIHVREYEARNHVPAKP